MTGVVDDALRERLQKRFGKAPGFQQWLSRNGAAPAPAPDPRATALAELLALHDCEDFENAHSRADDVLCRLLSAIGYGDVVEAWAKVERFYA